MTGPASLVAIIAVLGALVLAVSALKSHQLSSSRMVRYAGIWAVIIVGLVLVVKMMGA